MPLSSISLRSAVLYHEGVVVAERIQRLLDHAYERPCFICQRCGRCGHREPDVEMAFHGIGPVATDVPYVAQIDRKPELFASSVFCSPESRRGD